MKIIIEIDGNKTLHNVIKEALEKAMCGYDGSLLLDDYWPGFDEIANAVVNKLVND